MPEEEQVFEGSIPLASSEATDTFEFAGLASDPSGTALIAGGSSSTNKVQVFEWPLALPGFPELQ